MTLAEQLAYRAATHRASRLGYLYTYSDAKMDESAAALIGDLLGALVEIVDRPSIAAEHPSIVKAKAAIAKAAGQ